MKKYLFLLFVTGWAFLSSKAQRLDSLSLKRGKNQVLGVGIYLPTGVFADSHIAGAGIDYSWSRHRFGKGVSPAKPIGLILNGGINYYLGKTITTTGYDFRYGGYLNFYALAGAIVNPIKNGNISLTAGPVLNLYKKSFNAGMSIHFLTNYFLSENIAIGPGVIFQKHKDSDALWSVGVRMAYAF